MNNHQASFIWDDHLIEKYDLRGPRYTSYPTALQFSEQFSVSDYNRQLAFLDKQEEKVSVYIHIPFCENICYYCACNKIVTGNRQSSVNYLNYLEKEAALIIKNLDRNKEIIQLHFGGGTPTFLSDEQFDDVMKMLANFFTLSNGIEREYSIEIDPRTIDLKRLSHLKKLGFNRLSFGVQDFSEQVQKAINRINDYDSIKNMVAYARELKFDSINLDFIYGLPFQTAQSLNDTLDKIIQLGPERIAFYNYAHLPERFPPQRSIDRLTLPSAKEKLNMLKLIHQRLTQASYVDIGMDHFVKSSDEMAVAQQQGYLTRNFQGYSTSKSPVLIGMGVSSISSGEHFFSQNHKKLDEYYQSLDEGNLPVEKGYLCTEDDIKRRDVIMGLISNFTYSIDDWNERYNDNFHKYFKNEIKKLEEMESEDELLSIQPSVIDIQKKGRPFIRMICSVFDLYTHADSKGFSRVI